MKKILSLTLAALMVVSMVPTAFAADVDYQNGTEVEYTGSRTTVNADGTETHNAEYTITVPALLAPGGSGTVTLTGYWPSDATVKVTADASVDMLNSINNADKKTLTVTFAGIELAGSNTATVTDNEAVSVSDISAALFGTWAGKFNYNVEYNGEAGGSGTVTPTPDPEQPVDPDTGDDEIVLTKAGAAFNDGTILTWEELKLEENGTKYGYKASNITDSSIGDGSFGSVVNDNTSLISIFIPDSVTSIDYDAFRNSAALTRIDVDANNQTYCSVDGVLYSKDMTTLVAYPRGKADATFVIPNTVTTIDTCAFYNNFKLTNITLPDNLTTMEWEAFYNTGITSIDIPESVTKIGGEALKFCSNLTEINYAGTMEQWADIELSSSWNDDVPATKVICSDGTVEI